MSTYAGTFVLSVHTSGCLCLTVCPPFQWSRQLLTVDCLPAGLLSFMFLSCGILSSAQLSVCLPLLLLACVCVQFSGILCTAFLTSMWYLAVVYSMVVVGMVYTYQFDYVANSWNQSLSEDWLVMIKTFGKVSSHPCYFYLNCSWVRTYLACTRSNWLTKVSCYFL